MEIDLGYYKGLLCKHKLVQCQEGYCCGCLIWINNIREVIFSGRRKNLLLEGTQGIGGK